MSFMRCRFHAAEDDVEIRFVDKTKNERKLLPGEWLLFGCVSVAPKTSLVVTGDGRTGVCQASSFIWLFMF